MEIYYDPRVEVEKTIQDADKLIEMSKFESAFVCGLIKENRPGKIVEVGVAAGGTTAVILQCLDMLDMNDETEFYSVDLNPEYYREKGSNKETGFLGNQIKQHIKPVKHEFVIGQVLPECVDRLGGGIDLVILDTAHCMPGELLDYPVVLPYLSDSAIIILHDTGAHQYDVKEENATQIVLDVAVGEKVIPLGMDGSKEDILPNISAIRETPDSMKYVDDIFHAMILNWTAMPDSEQLKSYYNFYKKHYKKELADWFALAVRLNRNYKIKKKGRLPFLKRFRRCAAIMLRGF